MKKALVGIVFLVGCVLLTAQAQWRAGGEVVPDTEWRKSAGTLGAMLMVTDDPDGFFERWNQPSSPEYKPELTTVSTARRGDIVMAVVVFFGCSADASGSCQSEVDFKVLYPDGSVYGDLKNGELWKDKPSPPVPNLQVSVANLMFKIEDNDPFGAYRLEAVVRDGVANQTLDLIQTLEVIDP